MTNVHAAYHPPPAGFVVNSVSRNSYSSTRLKGSPPKKLTVPCPLSTLLQISFLCSLYFLFFLPLLSFSFPFYHDRSSAPFFFRGDPERGPRNAAWPVFRVDYGWIGLSDCLVCKPDLSMPSMPKVPLAEIHLRSTATLRIGES